MRFGLLLFFALCLWLHANPVIAQNGDIPLSENQILFYIDSTNTLQAKEVYRLSRQFKTMDQLPAFDHYKNRNLWLAAKTSNLIHTDKNWYLEAIDPHIDFIQPYFFFKDSLLTYQEAGFHQTFHKRSIFHKNFTYEIPRIEKEYPHTALLRVNVQRPVGLFFKFRSGTFLIKYISTEYLLLGVFYGILLFLILYNLFVFITLKDRLHLYFVFYILGLCLITLHDDGLGFQWLWKNTPEWNIIFTYSRRVLFLLVFIIYSSNFIKAEKFTPQFMPFLYLTVILSGLANVLGELDILTPDIQATLYLAPFFLIYFMGLISAKKGYLPSRFFVFGYSFMLLSILINVTRMGLANIDSIWYAYAIYIGMLIEIISLSWGLSLKFSLLKQQKEKAHKRIIRQLRENEKIISDTVDKRTLEVKNQQEIIALRNRELEEAHQQLKAYSLEIEAQNSLLEKANIALEADVEDLTNAHVLDKDLSYEDFQRKFPDEEACLSFIDQLKWKDQYKCIKCGNDKYARGQGRLSRRCSKCGFNETVTRGTLFYRSHFTCQQGLYMLYLTYHSQFKMPAQTMSEQVGLNQNTCWKFQKRVKERDYLLKKHQLTQPELGWAMYILDPKVPIGAEL
ncbi:7TM diverse intracellular signaling domain-containing protein [Persicobacter diffluens]|uniref:Receptor n=1 Tax=Persicobacter diffluens TaxID=981 RepID=A0AAN5AML1_9BACT|nr:hypothetical protein PEDI_30530 [Persicobacter diffluens]